MRRSTPESLFVKEGERPRKGGGISLCRGKEKVDGGERRKHVGERRAAPIAKKGGNLWGQEKKRSSSECKEKGGLPTRKGS